MGMNVMHVTRVTRAAVAQPPNTICPRLPVLAGLGVLVRAVDARALRQVRTVAQGVLVLLNLKEAV